MSPAYRFLANYEVLSRGRCIVLPHGKQYCTLKCVLNRMGRRMGYRLIQPATQIVARSQAFQWVTFPSFLIQEIRSKSTILEAWRCSPCGRVVSTQQKFIKSNFINHLSGLAHVFSANLFNRDTNLSPMADQMGTGPGHRRKGAASIRDLGNTTVKRC